MAVLGRRECPFRVDLSQSSSASVRPEEVFRWQCPAMVDGVSNGFCILGFSLASYTEASRPVAATMNTLTFVIAICLIAASLCATYRWMLGWGMLERAHADRNSRERSSISLGSYRWVNCSIRAGRISLAVEFYPEGLWMRPVFPCSIWMRPVIVPWHCLKVLRNSRLSFGKVTTFKISQVAFSLRIRGAIGKTIEEAVRSSRGENAAAREARSKGT